MATEKASNIALGALTAALACAVLTQRSADAVAWNLTILAVAATATFVGCCQGTSARTDRTVQLLALLVLAFVALQLVPFPIAVVRFLSPQRAEVAEAVARITGASGFSPLTVAPAVTGAHLARLIACVLTFLTLSKLARRSVNRPWVPTVPLIIVGSLSATVGVMQHLGGQVAPAGTYLNRGEFSALLEMIVPFALTLGAVRLCSVGSTAWSSFSIWVAVAVAGPVSLMLFAILNSLSRMGLVSTAVSLLVIGSIALRSIPHRATRVGSTVALGASVALFVVFLIPAALVERLGNLGETAAIGGRLPIWRDTLDLVAAFPLFGSGLGAYSLSFVRYQTSQLNAGWSHAHNDYLELLSELGIAGSLIAAALLAMIVSAAIRGWRQEHRHEARWVCLACLGSLVAISIHSLADFPLDAFGNQLVLAWTCGVAVGCTPPRSDADVSPWLRGLPSTRPTIIVVACLSALYAGLSLASLLATRGSERAADAFCRIGICEESLVVSQQVSEISAADERVSRLRRLVAREPTNPVWWSDLGDSLLATGRSSEAALCFTRATQLAPQIPFVAYRVARFYFAIDNDSLGLSIMARAIAGDSSNSRPAFDEYEEREIPLEDIVRAGLPIESRVWQSYLRYQMAQANPERAKGFWEPLVVNGFADLTIARQYVAYLLQRKEAATAFQAWALAADHLRRGYPPGERIFDGDFEFDPSGVQFDWRVNAPQGVATDVDQVIRHSGERSLRLGFDGTTNLTNLGVQQLAYLDPGRYRFSAYVRTQDITTDEGVSFTLGSEGSRTQSSTTTRPLRGSNDWTLVEELFDAPAEGGLVRVSLTRRRSFRFDNLISGTAWIDQVSITPVAE